MASLSTCHLGLWHLGWQILLNLDTIGKYDLIRHCTPVYSYNTKSMYTQDTARMHSYYTLSTQPEYIITTAPVHS